MKAFKILIFTLLLSISSFASTQYISSLSNGINTVNITDTIKIADASSEDSDSSC